MPLLNTIIDDLNKAKDTKPVENPTKVQPSDGMSRYIKVYRKCKSGWAGVKEQSYGMLVSCPCEYTERFATRRAADAFIQRYPQENLGVFTVNPAKKVGAHAFTIRTRD